MSRPPSVVIPAIQRPRRTNRKAASFPIWLRHEAHGPVWEEETETQIVSRRGAGLSCRHLLKSDGLVVIARRDTGQRASARVRYCRYRADGNRDLGIEILEQDNFWGLDWNFPEPIASQPEQIRIPSGRVQMNEAILVANAQERNKMGANLGLHNESSSVNRKSEILGRQPLREETFVFTQEGKPSGITAQTLKELLSALICSEPPAIEGHLHRGDFSRWVAKAFDDYFLASEIRKIEQRHRDDPRGLSDSLSRLIIEYCEFSEERES